MNSYEIDKKLEPILRQIEKNGVLLDIGYLSKLSEKIDKDILYVKNKIFKLLGHNFNLNSPKQLSNILYNKLKINYKNKKIKSGKLHISTNASSLEKIKSLHPAIKDILNYRELTKLKNTYITPLPKLIDKNKRIHTHYAIDTSTGRLSSKNPNLQNIPIKTSLGEKIRRSFIAQENYKLLKADYSQIELRVIASLSGDRKMIEIFNKNGDIHTETAQKINSSRRMAKIVNFGIIYGMSSYGLSETLKIPLEEAQDFIDRYFLTFHEVKKYIDSTINQALSSGFTQTMFGRKRQIPELFSPIDKIRNYGIRAAINTPVQGTAAEIIKLAMISLEKIISSECKLILQVHDELVFEIKEEKLNFYTKKIKKIMENVVKLKVPIVVDLSVGKNWQQTKKLTI